MLHDAVDYWCNAFTPDRMAPWQQAIDNQGLGLKVHRDGDEFCEPPEMVSRLDAAGFSTVILVACEVHAGPEVDSFEHVACRPDEVADLAAGFPGRFVGVWSVDPTRGPADVALADQMLREPWCMGLHNHTHSWDRRFDHADFAPYYELCAQSDTPFVMQAGASGGNFPHECGHPSGIVGPATDFPTVRFLLSHTGAPWTDETVDMAKRFENVFVGTATWPLHRWPEVLIDYLRGEGRSKVLYGSGFPTSGHSQAARQFQTSDFDEATLDALTSTNARNVFTRLPKT